MLEPTDIIVAVIGLVSGLVSGLSVVLVQDLFVIIHQERRLGRRQLLQQRLERVYSPLEYLIFMLLRTSDPGHRQQIIQEMGAILRQHGHLLSEQALSACYVVLEDANSGADLVRQYFVPECAELKRAYYRTWGVKPEHWPAAGCNTEGDTSWRKESAITLSDREKGGRIWAGKFF